MSLCLTHSRDNKNFAVFHKSQSISHHWPVCQRLNCMKKNLNTN